MYLPELNGLTFCDLQRENLFLVQIKIRSFQLIQCENLL